jgi:hypothetical protein
MSACLRDTQVYALCIFTAVVITLSEEIATTSAQL